MRGLLALVILVILAVPVVAYRNAKYHSIRYVDFTITMLPDRSMQYNANGDKNTYANLVYTDKGTFQNTDSTFPWKKNSSDLYGELQKGKSYRCEVAGWRLGLFSTYPDLISCKEA